MTATKSRFATVRSKLAKTEAAPSLSSSLSDAAKDLNSSAGKVDVGFSYVDVPIENIHKVYNPRVTPCTFEEFKNVKWPALNTPHEDIPSSISNCLNTTKPKWWSAMSAAKQEEVLGFLVGIHLLSASLASLGQQQNIVVHRESPQTNDFELIAGERRILAAWYSNGALSTLLSKTYNSFQTPLQIAQIRDEENEKEPLTTQEKIASKQGVWLALPKAEREAMTLEELALLWRYKTVSVPSVLRRLFKHQDVDMLLSIINERKLQIREIEFIIKNGVAAFDAQQEHPATPIEDDTQPGSATTKTNAPPQDRSRFKKLGVEFGAKSKPDLFQFALRIISKSDQIPASLRESLQKIDLESHDELLEGITLIADFIEDQ